MTKASRYRNCVAGTCDEGVTLPQLCNEMCNGTCDELVGGPEAGGGGGRSPLEADLQQLAARHQHRRLAAAAEDADLHRFTVDCDVDAHHRVDVRAAENEATALGC